MDDNRIRIEDIIYELKMDRRACTEEREEYPEGRLYHDRQNGKHRYFVTRHVDNKYRRKTITDDEQMIRALARKEYLDKKLEVIDYNIDILDRIKDKVRDISSEEIIDSMKGAYKTLPEEFFVPEIYEDDGKDGSKYAC